MKKYILSSMMILVVFLIIGCSAYDPMTEDISIYDDLTFSFETLTYTETSERDILYHIGHPSFDFIMLYEKNNPDILSEADQLLYQGLLETLYDLSILSAQSIRETLLLSSSELRVLYEVYDQSIGLSDIVIFNNIKSILTDLETSNDIDLSLSKISYINMRLSISLTSENISALENLQNYHQSFEYYDMSVYINDETFDTWLEKLTLIGEAPHESDLVLYEAAFNLIKNLIIAS